MICRAGEPEADELYEIAGLPKELYMLQCGVSLRSNRGAAFLMLVYLSALVMLLLGGVSLQRTSVEVRASQLSGNMQQAFWLAETGIDKGLLAMRSNKPLSALSDAQLAEILGNANYVKFAKSPTLMDGTYGPFTTATGTYTIKVETTKIKVLGPQGMQLTRAITSTGTAAGKAATVTITTVSDTIPLKGILANGPISAIGGLTVWGSLHTHAGVPGSVYFSGDNLAIFGDVTINTPDSDPAKGYTKLLGTPQWMKAWDCCVSGGGTINDMHGLQAALRDGAGIVVSAGHHSSDWPKNVITGGVAAVEMPKIEPIDLPADLTESADSLVVPAGETREFDGNGTTPIRMRVKSLALGRNSKLVFKSPVELYIDGSLTSDPGNLGDNYNGWSKVGSAIYLGTDSALVALDASGHTLEDGVSLRVTRAGPGTAAGTVIADMPATFYGSVWAPESDARLAATFSMMNYEPWMDLDEYLKDDDTPGGLKGTKNPYIVVNSLQLGPNGAGGCSGFIVEDEKSQQSNNNGANNKYTVTSWRNSQQAIGSN